MKSDERRARCLFWIDTLGLLGLGILSLCYVISQVLFAEKNIQLPFLNFPIFVGEIFLFVYLILWGLRMLLSPPVYNLWSVAVGAYFIFVLIKAGVGYYEWGPLAFRNAVLLFYPIFILFSYSFFRMEFFRNKVVLIGMFLIIIGIYLYVSNIDYWALSLLYIASILVFKIDDKRLQIPLAIVLLLSLPYDSFFHTSRMMILGNIISWLFISISFILIIQMPVRYKFLIFFVSLLLFGVGFYKFADYNRTMSMFRLDIINSVLKDFEGQVAEQKDHVQLPAKRDISLYQPNIPLDKRSKEDLAGMVKALKKRNYVLTTENQDLESVSDGEELVVEVAETLVPTTMEPVKEEVKESSPVVLVEKVNEPALVDLVEKKGEVVEEEIEDVALLVKEEVPAVTETLLTTRSEVLEVIKVADVKEAEPEVVDLPVVEVTETPVPTTVEPVKVEETVAVTKHLLLAKEEGEIREMAKESTQEELMAMVKELETKNNVLEIESKRLKSPEHFFKNKDEHEFNPDLVNNAVFRIFIWKDMIEEFIKEKPLWGFSFGKPLRSKRLEILEWGDIEWERDGWVAAHNSYLHMIYRAGIVGVAFILVVFTLFFRMMIYFLRHKLIVGLLLISTLTLWFVAANFLVILEMPYTAIPIWNLYGVTLYYYQQHRRNLIKDQLRG